MALFPILSTIYMAPIMKIFKKRIKKLIKKIPTDILSFVDDGLLISQKKSFDLLFIFLLSSYNIISKILLKIGLVIEHSKSEVFYFTRACNPYNPSINLSLVEGPILYPKYIWWYLGFFFDWKLTFHYHIYPYTTKCLSTLNAMKLLENSLHSILSLQKWLLYRICILSMVLYRFQLWFFKGTPVRVTRAE